MREAKWCVKYTDIYGNKKTEAFDSESDAQRLYENLLPRTYGMGSDIESVSAPAKSTEYGEKVSEGLEDKRYDVFRDEWEDFGAVMKEALLGTDDNAEGRYFKVRHVPDGDYYEVYHKGEGALLPDLLILTVWQSSFGDEPFSVVCGDVNEETFDDAYGIVEPLLKDVLRMTDNEGKIGKYYDSDSYRKSLKTEAAEDSIVVDIDDLANVVHKCLSGFNGFRGNHYTGRASDDSASPYDDSFSVFSKTGSPVLVLYRSMGGDAFKVDVVNCGLDSAAFDEACDAIEPLVSDAAMLIDGDRDNVVFRKFASMDDYDKSVKEDCGSSAASLGAVPTGGSRMTRTDDESVVRTRHYGHR